MAFIIFFDAFWVGKPAGRYPINTALFALLDVSKS
jgi:hypothetical protein